MGNMKSITTIFDLNNKIAIVTGGYSYLGTAIVQTLYDFGATVIVGGRSNEKFLEAFQNLDPKKVHFLQLDITQSESINHSFDHVLNQYGNIDILINNAQASKGTFQENMSDEDWNYTMEGVVGSVYKTIRSVIPTMKHQLSGKIINITSMYGLVSPDFESLYKGEGCEQYTNPPHYGAAKAAVIQLTRYFAVLLGKYNIQVNAIAPGPFPHPNIQESNSAFIERLKSKNPLHKIGKPEDLTGVVALLSSSASDFITGQTIQIDGGWTIW